MKFAVSTHEPTGLPHVILFRTTNDEISELYQAADAYDRHAQELLKESLRIAKLGTAARQEATRLLRAGMGGHL